MQCVHEFRIDGAPLSAYLAACTQPFSTSSLYSTALATSLVDESRRRSKFRDLRDPALFALCEDAVRGANAADPGNTYLLLRNNATHIVYEPGDFFQRHNDFLSLTSNIIEEYTLIIGLAPPHPPHQPPPEPGPELEGRTCQGGETALYVNDQSEHLTTLTSTPGGCLLFRKDVSHEGRVIHSGVKHILTLNLWAVAKQAHNNTHPYQILHITFKAPDGDLGPAPDQPPVPKRPKPQGTGGASSSAVPASNPASLLHQAAKAESYAISCARLPPNCLLARFVAFNAQQQQEQQFGPVPGIIQYECDNASYAAFGTVYRAIHRMHLSREEVQEQAALLDYHQIPTHFCLIDEANQDFKPPAGPTTRARARASAAASAAAGRPLASPADANDEDIIICATQERAQLVSALAKSHGLPYVTFQMLFCEGELIYNDDDGGMDNEVEPLPMTPVFVAFGDYRNVYLVRRLLSRDSSLDISGDVNDAQRFGFDRFLDPAYQQHSLGLFNTPGNDVVFGTCYKGCISTGSGYYQSAAPPPPLSHTVILAEDHPDDEETVLWGLRAAYTTTPQAAGPGAAPGCLCEGPDEKEDWRCGTPASAFQLPGIVLATLMDGRADPFPCMRTFPGCSEAAAAAPHDPQAGRFVSSCFHLDERGNSCFTPEEAQAACKRITQMGLLDKVKDKISSTDFRLPQESHKVASVFCNDERYGNLSVVLVCGLCCMP